MFQVVEAVIAVTVVAELSVCKAVTVSERKERQCKRSRPDTFRVTSGCACSHTHSLRHCDLVQLHGFLGLEVVSAVDKLRDDESHLDQLNINEHNSHSLK